MYLLFDTLSRGKTKKTISSRRYAEKRRAMHSYGFMYGDDLAVLLAGAFPGVTWHPCERTRAGRVPASYPIASTRRLMSPVADARTGQRPMPQSRGFSNCICNINKQVGDVKVGR